MRTISLIGGAVPSTFDICVIATILVRLVSARSKASSENEPSSATSTHFSTAPLRSRWKCQGTMLAWCSITESTISSPAPICARPKLAATRLIASVAERVKTISSIEAALRKRRTLSRAAS